MATPRFAWGIDIGNRALKAVKLVSSGDGLVIDDFDVIDHETVLSAAGDNRDSLIQTALATFVQRHPGIDKGQVGVGVTGQQSFARFIKLPPVEPNKIPEIVRFEAIQQIPFPLDEVEWSYQLFQDPESPEVEVGIFAMRKDLVTQHIKFFTDARLNVQLVQMNPLSVYNAMYYDSRIKGCTMIVDIGAENTDLIIAEGETIWLRSISIGGNSFTEALTKAFKVNFVKAEELKRNASTSKYGRQIMQAMRPIFSDLVSEIQRSIGFYSSVHKESRIAKVVAVGSTFKLPGLHRYLSQNLTLDVEKLDRLGSGALEDPKIAAVFSDNILSAAGAYGLALQVMGQGKIGSSLLPETIRRDKMWAEKTKWFVGAAALFMVGAVIPYGRVYYEGTQVNSNENLTLQHDITKVKADVANAERQWDTIASAGKEDRQRMLNVLALTNGRDIWPNINELLYNTLPQNAPDGQKELSSTNPVEIKKIPRLERKQIVIEALYSRYVPDINAVTDLTLHDKDTAVDMLPTGSNIDSQSNSGGQASMPTAGIGPQPKPQRGFIVTLKLSTPYDSGFELIEKKFVDPLKAIVPAADHPIPVQVVGSSFGKQNKIRDDQTRISAMTKAWQDKQARAAEAAKMSPSQGGGGMGGGGMGGGGMGGGAMGGGGTPMGGGMGGTGGMPGPMGGGGRGFPSEGGNRPQIPGAGGNSFGGPNFPGAAGQPPTGANIVPDEAFQDPVLKEDLRNDTEVIVVLTIAIDPPAPAAVPAAPGAGKTVASAGPPSTPPSP